MIVYANKKLTISLLIIMPVVYKIIQEVFIYENY